jgi:hypothetical protein
MVADKEKEKDDESDNGEEVDLDQIGIERAFEAIVVQEQAAEDDEDEDDEEEESGEGEEGREQGKNVAVVCERD